MEKTKIEQNNALIAEFMKWKFNPSCCIHFPKGTWTDLKKVEHCADRGLAFHSSWDWLMPVVKKISQQLSASDIVDYWGDLTEKTIEKRISFYNNDIVTVYNAVITFIKWYKSRYEK